ncbi:toxin-antitoxin system YwqK family antitoxin [Leptospira ilyithenensis]|uniref:Toxin-antitoxin system YwqK family antitoxin n=1 Tax=Leptospira ilyithenensis TaxID=2484901 RepID=A0A4R9LMM0_9LEPT|nr:hypothetical protein [Leptospira ilyithenensis]TGN09811.1 hypothetical protein EHS11_12100 [Leptospira ilyithenensis]
MATKDQYPIRSFLITLLNFLIVVSLIHCQGGRTIESTDPDIALFQGRIFYKAEPFDGTIKQEIPALAEVQFTHYKTGLEDGEYTARNQSGQILEQRYFKEGQKHGIHRSWFPNGSNKQYAEFNEGTYINDRWEWYDNDKPSLYEKFDSNGRLIVSKKWNRNGQIYMNIVFTDNGSSVGMPGSKICEPIKKQDRRNVN